MGHPRSTGAKRSPFRHRLWRAHRRPRWWQELLLIGIGYWLYGLARNAVTHRDALARAHGRSIEHLQESLGLNVELSINKFVAAREPIAQIADYYYSIMHFAVTAVVLVWMFRVYPEVYRRARTVLFITSLLGLIGFALYPLAPPRLLPQFGYIDTVVKFHTWGSLADPQIAGHSNQYAAMPSLHMAWALWCGLVVFRCARTRWIATLALLYPVATFLVILATANHFVVDAAAGVVAVVLAFAIQRLLSGSAALTPASLVRVDEYSRSPRERVAARG